MKSLKQIRQSLLDGTYRATILLYGPYGSGKTQFISTMPRPFIHDFDNGLLTVVNKPNVDGVTYSDETASRVISLFEKNWNESVAREDVDTLAIDSLTTLASYKMADALKKSGRSEKDIPQIQDWGAVVRWLEVLFYQVTTVQTKHLIVTAHERILEDTKEGTVRVVPLLAGSRLPGMVGVWFDEVYHASVRGSKQNPKFEITTRPTPRLDGKSRLASIAKIEPVEEPDWSGIWSKVQEAVKNLKGNKEA